MKTMLDVVVEYTLKNCKDNKFIEFDQIFDNVENQLKDKWEKEAQHKNVKYQDIRLNKIGELYRLLTVDSRFIRNNDGLWSVRIGFK